MAKPKHGRRNIAPLSLDARKTSRPSRLIPSHAVLSALAVIAASPSSVAGGPLPSPTTTPPAFLCPSIHRDHPVVPALLPLARRDPTPSSSTTPPSPTTIFERALVADKYVQDVDSLWRKTDRWTLYGSTCCSGSTSSTPPTQSSQTHMPTSDLSSAEFDTSVLPAGWNSLPAVSSSNKSTTILALAIALAGSICVFMLVCLLWRRRKKKARDPELRLARKLDSDGDPKDNGQDTEAYGKMRMWTRATARWRSNIRQSARRRRKRHTTTAVSIASRPLSPISSSEADPPVSLPTPTPASACTSSLDPTLSDPPIVPPERPRSASPPTYGASLAPSSSHHPPLSAVYSLPSTPSPDNQPSFAVDEPIPYVPPSDGHVATDDKAQLARIRELASSPPTMVDVVGATAMQPVSVPEWHEVEDDLDDLGIDLNQVPMSLPHCNFPPSFPLPPSTSDVPFGHLHDSPLCYGNVGDISGTRPASASPQPLPEVSPSAPCIDDLGLEPSAPPLEGDVFQDWDEASLDVPGAPNSVDLDSSPSCGEESTTVSFTSHVSSSSMRDSVARDDVPPRYHP